MTTKINLPPQIGSFATLKLKGVPNEHGAFHANLEDADGCRVEIMDYVYTDPTDGRSFWLVDLTNNNLPFADQYVAGQVVTNHQLEVLPPDADPVSAEQRAAA